MSVNIVTDIGGVSQSIVKSMEKRLLLVRIHRIALEADIPPFPVECLVSMSEDQLRRFLEHMNLIHHKVISLQSRISKYEVRARD